MCQLTRYEGAPRRLRRGSAACRGSFPRRPREGSRRRRSGESAAEVGPRSNPGAELEYVRGSSREGWALRLSGRVCVMRARRLTRIRRSFADSSLAISGLAAPDPRGSLVRGERHVEREVPGVRPPVARPPAGDPPAQLAAGAHVPRDPFHLEVLGGFDEPLRACHGRLPVREADVHRLYGASRSLLPGRPRGRTRPPPSCVACRP